MWETHIGSGKPRMAGLLQAKQVGATSAECRGATDIVGDAAALPPMPPDAVPPVGWCHTLRPASSEYWAR